MFVDPNSKTEFHFDERINDQTDYRTDRLFSILGITSPFAEYKLGAARGNVREFTHPYFIGFKIEASE